MLIKLTICLFLFSLLITICHSFHKFTQNNQFSSNRTLRSIPIKSHTALKRVCIYPNWSALRTSKEAQLLPERIDPNICTHIHYAYANVDVRTLKLIPSQIEDIQSGSHGEVSSYRNYTKYTEVSDKKK